MSREQTASVAIVGRPNVGKSAIFNRLIGKRISIVHDQPGVTRDRIVSRCKKTTIPFDLVDTGGIGAQIDQDFFKQVEIEGEIAIQTAHLILFVVDGADGLTPLDENLSDLLRKSNTPIFLLINKVDHEKRENVLSDFLKLGYKTVFTLSAAHGRGFDQLIKKIDGHLKKNAAPRKEEKNGKAPGERQALKIAIVGRPNVGKSSLVNAILKEERAIVSDISGTTRDAIDVLHERGRKEYLFIDTAGLRPRKKRKDSIEVFSAMRSEKSIRRADLCLLVLDTASGVLSQDRKIAQIILRAEKPCILVLNKFDLFHPTSTFKDRLEEISEHVRKELFFLHYAPLVAISALKKEFIDQLFKTVEKVTKNSRNTLGTGELNRLLQKAIAKTPPPAIKRKRFKLLYATTKIDKNFSFIQVPTYILFVNHQKLLTGSYRKYLEKEIRKEKDSPGIPILFTLHDRTKTKELSG